MIGNDRRDYQRLRLAKPILAMLDSQNALILDIGIGGAFIEHYGAIAPHVRFKLLFRWKSEDVEFIGQAVRSAVVRGEGTGSVSHTTVRFVEPVGDSESRLNDMIATYVGRILAAQRSNASGLGQAGEDLPLAQLGGARRSRTRGYVTYRLQNDSWQRAASTSPDQPEDGFTVAAYEDEDELATLCRSYEVSNDETRRLIRLVADLSTRSVKKA